MKIDSKTIQVYDWFAIQEAICKEMQIENHQFRSYHEVVGTTDGLQYKDLWHIALDSIIPATMSNGTIVKLWSNDIGYYKNKHPVWTKDFFRAAEVVFKKLDPSKTGFYVRFSW